MTVVTTVKIVTVLAWVTVVTVVTVVTGVTGEIVVTVDTVVKVVMWPLFLAESLMSSLTVYLANLDRFYGEKVWTKGNFFCDSYTKFKTCSKTKFKKVGAVQK